MALGAALPAVSRSVALSRSLSARTGLAVIVSVSFAARLVATAGHSVPRYFPDEYLYTSIARAFAAGSLPTVRGQVVDFPGVLAPALAAPFQALFSPVVAYRLTQAENALAMSLAAIPVYLLARKLKLTAPVALACAAFAVAIPDLVYSSFTLTDPIAYPLVLGALLLGRLGARVSRACGVNSASCSSPHSRA